MPLTKGHGGLLEPSRVGDRSGRSPAELSEALGPHLSAEMKLVLTGPPSWGLPLPLLPEAAFSFVGGHTRPLLEAPMAASPGTVSGQGQCHPRQ